MNIFKTYFDDIQLALLLLGGLFFLLSLITHSRKNYKYSVLFLILLAISLFSFSALLDPFLNIWDERFHALVAKNLMNHPLMPTLYEDPIVNMNYDSWDRYHIWLHKQPLFLWQIALSFKLFGISEFTLRLPSIILCTVLVYITYRSGKLIVSERVGYVAGLLVISTLYIIQLVAGRQELEHNDISFLAYVSLSIWSFIEYYYTKNKIWIYLIGLFAGMAILCKWLVGLLVYFGWIALRIMQKKVSLRENKDILISLLVTTIVFLPWQILTFLWYPTEAMQAYRFNTIHFSVPVEGHSGDIWYHFDMFSNIYGAIASFLIVPAFIILYRTNKDKKLLNALMSMVFMVYLFFTLAATKMPSFTIIVSMIIFIAFASLIDYIINYINSFIEGKNAKKIVFSAFIVAVVLIRFDIEYLQEKHTLWKKDNQYSRMLSHNKKVFESLDLSSNTILFNVKGRHYIEAMFYTDLPAYNFIPSFEQYQDIKNKGRTIAIFTKDKSEIQNYLKNDDQIIFINKEIKGYN